MAKPGIATELIVASVFISVLALASPIFVMQVLNRYVSQGVDSTLVTLTVGVLVAIALELAFRQARMHLAQRVSAESDEDMSADGYKILTRSKLGSLEQVAPDGQQHEQKEQRHADGPDGDEDRRGRHDRVVRRVRPVARACYCFRLLRRPAVGAEAVEGVVEKLRVYLRPHVADEPLLVGQRVRWRRPCEERRGGAGGEHVAARRMERRGAAWRP